MKDLKDIESVYFIGIGGIGMSALARYFKSRGKKVSGYDRTETSLTRSLEDEGIAVHFDDDPGKVPVPVDLVIYTPAIPATHQELEHCIKQGFPVLKRSDVLGMITRSSFNIAVAGTHGKTTITTMIAHMLRHSGYGCNAFLGGISVNYQTNYWSDQKNVSVMEADEYDRSFLKLSPDIAVITSMDPDHLDIYGTPEEVENAFVEFSGKLKEKGWLLFRYGLKRNGEFKVPDKSSYHLDNTKADVYTENIRMKDGGYSFDVVAGSWVIRNLELNMGGLHNVENATAAIAVSQRLGIEENKIREAVKTFNGVKRRFEKVLQRDDLVFIDDYAHHPEELKALISSARKLFENRRCTVIFQPHLYSRTRDLADGFAHSLNLADEVILLPIYPAREKPIEGVESEMLAKKMDKGKVRVWNKPELMKWFEEGNFPGQQPGLLITAGAGDIDALVGPIRDCLKEKKEVRRDMPFTN